MKERLIKAKVKVGKYNVGLPGSESYNARTPRPIKLISEACILVSGTVTLVAAFLTPPGWLLILGGGATLAGRFIAKCFSE